MGGVSGGCGGMSRRCVSGGMSPGATVFIPFSLPPRTHHIAPIEGDRAHVPGCGHSDLL